MLRCLFLGSGIVWVAVAIPCWKLDKLLMLVNCETILPCLLMI